MARLLGAIERLRNERDGLRRDLEFLNVEQQFTVQSLEQKLAAATSTTPITPAFNTADLSALASHLQLFQDQVDHSTQTATVFAIVAQHMHEAYDRESAHVQSLTAALASSEERVMHAEHLLHERRIAVASLEQQLSSSTSSINAADAELGDLRSTIQRLEDELAQERSGHAETGAALA